MNRIDRIRYYEGILTVCVVLALIVLSIVWSGDPFTPLQQRTLNTLLVICGCSIAYCFIAGEITHNYSQMDKLWSLLPIVYLWVIAIRGGMSVRLVAFALIVTAWGVRLTVNFARKGAYRLKFWEGSEDYRWSIVRSNPIFAHGFAWTLFNLFFISAYQNLLVLAITLPALACMQSAAGFGIVDTVAAVLALAFLVLETISDEYQWRFYQTKKKLLARESTDGNHPAEAGSDGEPVRNGGADGRLPVPYDLGFNTTGPWAYMRHPNYLGEQGMWLSLYLFAVGAGAASHGLFHITMAGPLLLILLFMGSSALGESISSGKYPRYRDYIKQVFKYIPLRKFDPSRDEAESC